MLEETLIRETAQAKVQTARQQSNNNLKGPPAGTFAGLAKSTEESKGADSAVDALNENNFDVVQSPMRREGSIVDGKGASKGGKGMVPQEQYDALKARFIESETTFQRRLESINDLEKTIARREEQLVQMEKMYLGKLEESKRELDE